MRTPSLLLHLSVPGSGHAPPVYGDPWPANYVPAQAGRMEIEFDASGNVWRVREAWGGRAADSPWREATRGALATRVRRLLRQASQ